MTTLFFCDELIEKIIEHALELCDNNHYPFEQYNKTLTKAKFLNKCRLVCKQWNNIATGDRLWKKLCYEYFWKSNGKICHLQGIWCNFRHTNDGSLKKNTMPIEDWLFFEQKNLCKHFANQRTADIYPDYGNWEVPYYTKWRDPRYADKKNPENSSAALRGYVYVNEENYEVVSKYCHRKNHFKLGFKVSSSLTKRKHNYFNYFYTYINKKKLQ